MINLPGPPNQWHWRPYGNQMQAPNQPERMQFNGGIMPMGWRLDQLRRVGAMNGDGNWQGPGLLQSRLGRLWQWTP